MSSIQFACPCGKTYQVPGSYAGKFGTCKACGRRNQIPLFVDDVSLDDADADDTSIRNNVGGVAAKAKRSSGTAWAIGVPVFAVFWIVVAALLNSHDANGKFDGRKFPDRLNGIAEEAFMFALVVVPLLGPVVIARRGGLSIIQWVLACILFGVICSVAVSRIESPFGAISPEWKWISQESGLAALGSLVAAILYRPADKPERTT